MYSISINITINQWFWGFTLLHPAPFPALLWIIPFQSKLPTAQPRLKSSFGRIFAREADDAVLWVAIQLPWEGNSFPLRSGNVCNVLQLCHHFDLVQCVFWSNDSAKNKDRCQHHAVVKGQKQGRAQVNLVLGVGVAIVGFHQGQVNCIQQCQVRNAPRRKNHTTLEADWANFLSIIFGNSLCFMWDSYNRTNPLTAEMRPWQAWRRMTAKKYMVPPRMAFVIITVTKPRATSHPNQAQRQTRPVRPQPRARSFNTVTPARPKWLHQQEKIKQGTKYAILVRVAAISSSQDEANSVRIHPAWLSR